jgi:hypothetical protein
MMRWLRDQLASWVVQTILGAILAAVMVFVLKAELGEVLAARFPVWAADPLTREVVLWLGITALILWAARAIGRGCRAWTDYRMYSSFGLM